MAAGPHPSIQVPQLTGWHVQHPTILFHVFDDPGHGRRFHDTYNPSKKYLPAKLKEKEKLVDRYYDAPPEGRRDPSEEIQEALDKLKNELHVIK